MYSFEFTSKFSEQDIDTYLLHVKFNNEIVLSRFCQFQNTINQDQLDEYANNLIDLIEGYE